MDANEREWEWKLETGNWGLRRLRRVGSGNYETREIREKGGKKRHRAQYLPGGLGGLGVRSFSRKGRKEGAGTAKYAYPTASISFWTDWLTILGVNRVLPFMELVIEPWTRTADVAPSRVSLANNFDNEDLKPLDHLSGNCPMIAWNSSCRQFIAWRKRMETS